MKRRLVALLLAFIVLAPSSHRLQAQSGVWTNVTPAGITLDPDATAAGPTNNYGVQGVIADPLNPGVLYASATYQGMWKTTNYGLTWAYVTPGGTLANSPADTGRAQIRFAPDGSYILATALYPISGGSNGSWKSTNGAVTWTRYAVGAPNADDMGEFNILPTDVNRVVGISHSSPFALFESRDAGQTFTDQGQPGSAAPGEAIWLDANTILVIGEGDNGSGPGTYRGVRSGSTWPWTWTWTHVDNQQHWHGVSQIFIDPAIPAIWTGGGFGIHKSTDNGVTWSVVSTQFSAGIVGTTTLLYATANYATHGGFGPFMQHASRPAATSWTNDDPGLPAGLNNGWLSAAVVCDGTHWIIVSGNWNAGIWRYEEPGTTCTSGGPTPIPARIRFRPGGF